MVQLKVTEAGINWVGYIIFQFQYGTIKRNSILIGDLAKLHFNSNMVQLKVAKILGRHNNRIISIPIWYN